MSRSGKRRTRKLRRRMNRRLRFGDYGSKHHSRSGRTGKVAFTQRKEKSK